MINRIKKLFSKKNNNAPVRVIPPKGYANYQFGNVIIVEQNSRRARRKMEDMFRAKLKKVKH